MISARAASAVLAAWYWLLVAFLFAPLVVVVLFSLNDAEVSILPIRALSGRWYAMLMKDQTVLHALGNSLIVAVAAVVVSVLLGAPLAIGAHRHGGKVGRALVGFALVPMMIPALILGVSLLTLLNALNAQLSLVSVTLGHTLICLPYVVLVLDARLAGYDPRLDEAALDLGAGPLMLLWTITLPLLAPAITAAALLAFTLSFDDVVVAFFLTGRENTLPMTIWAMLRYGITPELNALAALTILVSALTALLAEMTLRNARSISAHPNLKETSS
jgi:spermidine/putrescine transport system permease protein